MVLTVKDEEKSQKDDGDEEREEKSHEQRQPEPKGEGFFHIYKSGQGYWTRMGTAGAAALVAALSANFLFRQLYVGIGAAGADQSTARKAALGITAAFLAIFGLICYWLMNKSSNVDFLIATDSEMKKVNWTSKKELWGSTKIVIIFMFLIAIMLFGFDILFGYLFHFMGVLEAKPF
jgi:preprotein translocase subunit SecE